MNLSEDNLIDLFQSVARIEQNLQTLNAAVLGNGKKGLSELHGVNQPRTVYIILPTLEQIEAEIAWHQAQ